MKKKECVSNIVTSGRETVGVRMPDNVIAQKLIQLANVPLATSSANISGEKSGIKIQDIMENFNNKVDYIIDIMNQQGLVIEVKK